MILGGSVAERQEEVVSRVCSTNSVSARTSLKTGTLSSRPMMHVGHTIICVPQEGENSQQDMIAAVTVERGRLVRVQTHYMDPSSASCFFAFVVWRCFFKTGRYIAINVAEVSIPFPNNNEFAFIQHAWRRQGRSTGASWISLKASRCHTTRQ